MALIRKATYAYINATGSQIVTNASSLVYTGDWSALTAYVPGNVAVYNSTNFCCITAHTDVVPSDNVDPPDPVFVEDSTVYWSVLVLLYATPSQVTDAELIGTANGAPDTSGLEFTTPVYDADGVITSSGVIWPFDGSTGTYTLTSKDATWDTWKSWIVTHDNSGKSVVQPAVTRRSVDGRVASPKPVLVVV